MHLLPVEHGRTKHLTSFLKKIYIWSYVRIIGTSTFIENLRCSHDSGRFVFNCMCASSGLPGRQINDACAISAQLSLILASSQFYVIVMAIALTLAIRNNIITIVFWHSQNLFWPLSWVEATFVQAVDLISWNNFFLLYRKPESLFSAHLLLVMSSRPLLLKKWNK